MYGSKGGNAWKSLPILTEGRRFESCHSEKHKRGGLSFQRQTFYTRCLYFPYIKLMLSFLRPCVQSFQQAQHVFFSKQLLKAKNTTYHNTTLCSCYPFFVLLLDLLCTDKGCQAKHVLCFIFRGSYRLMVRTSFVCPAKHKQLVASVLCFKQGQQKNTSVVFKALSKFFAFSVRA